MAGVAVFSTMLAVAFLAGYTSYVRKREALETARVRISQWGLGDLLAVDDANARSTWFWPEVSEARCRLKPGVSFGSLRTRLQSVNKGGMRYSTGMNSCALNVGDWGIWMDFIDRDEIRVAVTDVL